MFVVWLFKFGMPTLRTLNLYLVSFNRLDFPYTCNAQIAIPYELFVITVMIDVGEALRN
jgi:hypothetical protein